MTIYLWTKSVAKRPGKHINDMAFNWQTFKTRTLTAAIFVVVMLAGLLIDKWTFFALFSIVHFGCWWEYLKFVEKTVAKSLMILKLV